MESQTNCANPETHGEKFANTIKDNIVILNAHECFETLQEAKTRAACAIRDVDRRLNQLEEERSIKVFEYQRLTAAHAAMAHSHSDYSPIERDAFDDKEVAPTPGRVLSTTIDGRSAWKGEN